MQTFIIYYHDGTSFEHKFSNPVEAWHVFTRIAEMLRDYDPDHKVVVLELNGIKVDMKDVSHVIAE